MVNKKNFSEKIRFYRNKIGITQTELAEKLHVSFQAISNWERGNTLPDLDNLCDLSSIFGVSLDVLIKDQTYSDEKLFIGIDGGGSSTEFVLFSSSGRIFKHIRLQGTNATTIGVLNAIAVFQSGIDGCLSTNSEVQGIFMGCAGNFLEEIVKKLSAKYPHIPIRIDSDGVNALLSDNGDAAMICRTGTVFIRHEPNGLYRTFAGWGYQFGDFGSSYNFGREAICAAMAYEDGVESSPLIYSHIKEKLDKQGVIEAMTGLKDVSSIAEKAYIIFEAYNQGDAYAEEIIHSEMKRLARIVKSVCPNGGKIIACGDINQHYGHITLPILAQYVSENIEFILPELPPIYGACREACRRFGVSIDEEFFNNFASDYRKMTLGENCEF